MRTACSWAPLLVHRGLCATFVHSTWPRHSRITTWTRYARLARCREKPCASAHMHLSQGTSPVYHTSPRTWAMHDHMRPRHLLSLVSRIFSALCVSPPPSLPPSPPLSRVLFNISHVTPHEIRANSNAAAHAPRRCMARAMTSEIIVNVRH